MKFYKVLSLPEFFYGSEKQTLMDYDQIESYEMRFLNASGRKRYITTVERSVDIRANLKAQSLEDVVRNTKKSKARSTCEESTLLRELKYRGNDRSLKTLERSLSDQGISEQT